MEANYKNSKTSSYYFTLAQQLHPNKPQTHTSLHLSIHPTTSQTQQNFTFNKTFYPQHNKSALPYNPYHPKYRSASLPSECLVRNPSKNHFSYYDQLRSRDYIVGKNYHSMAQLKRDYLLARKRSFDSLGKVYGSSYQQRDNLYSKPLSVAQYSTGLNRFSKFDSYDKKVSKSTMNKGPLVKTNIKLYQKPDQNNRITQIHSSFEPQLPNHYKSSYLPNNFNQNQQRTRKQAPVINCSIQVKSDDEGRYFSTVQSQFPAVLNSHNTYYDARHQTFTTEAVLVKEYPNTFENLQAPYHIYKNQPIQNSLTSLNSQTLVQRIDKDIQTEATIKAKEYDTYIIRRKSSPLKVEEKHLANKPEYNQYLESMQNRLSQKQQKLQIKSPIKRKVINEYQMNSPKKHKTPSKPNSKRKSAPKTHAQNLGLKYYYSKYYLADQQNRQKNHTRSNSRAVAQETIRNHKPNKRPKDQLQSITPKTKVTKSYQWHFRPKPKRKLSEYTMPTMHQPICSLQKVKYQMRQEH